MIRLPKAKLSTSTVINPIEKQPKSSSSSIITSPLKKIKEDTEDSESVSLEISKTVKKP